MKHYYVGINGTNVICNENFFDGYITAYPLGEKNNIFFMDKKTDSNKFDDLEFAKWVKTQIDNILKDYPDTRFTFFNKKMEKICSFLSSKNIDSHNKWELIDFLNDKFKLRNYFKSKVPMLDYIYKTGADLKYSSLQETLKSDKFVLQSHTGAGGLTTHFIPNQDTLDNLNLEKETTYCISTYQENLPINVTLMISDSEIISLPISVQLIKNTGNFIYCGGDFLYPKRFKKEVSNNIEKLSKIIGSEIQCMGYRGICGVDYIICSNGEIKFMELNPRYQGSSFLISLQLQQFNSSIASINSDCFSKIKLTVPNIEINSSFVNCENDMDFQELGNPNSIIKKVENSTFRKIYHRSIIEDYNFEKPKNMNFICNSIL